MVVFLRPKKSLGQRIMVSRKWLSIIAGSLEIERSDVVIELGAGTGNLSEELLKRGPKKLVLVEKDPYMLSSLKSKFLGDERVEIVDRDIREIFPLTDYDKIAANPPYYLSSFIIIGLTRSRFKRAVLTFQKEFAERLIAQPGTSKYGSLSVIASLSFSIKKIGVVERRSFFPPPKVESVVLVLEPKDIPEEEKDLILKYGKIIFSRRKRTLRNVLKPILGEKSKEIPYSNRRPYHLTPKEVLEVATWLKRGLESN